MALKAKAVREKAALKANAVREKAAMDARIANAIRGMDAAFARDTAAASAMATKAAVKKLLLKWHSDKIAYHIASIPDAAGKLDELIRPAVATALGRFTQVLTAALEAI